MRAFVTQLQNTQVKRTTYAGRGPIWEARWMAEDEQGPYQAGYAAYDLRVLLKEVIQIQGDGK